MNSTLEYYNEKAQKYFDDSYQLDVTETQDRFLSHVKENGKILDLGCGSGRDTKYFISKGYESVPVDGSKEMCRLASEYLGMPVQCLEFHDLKEKDAYDAVFASASLMHLSYEDLVGVFPSVIEAIRKDGVLYTSFKYGDTDKYLGKRYYTFMTEERIHSFLAVFPEITLLEIWVTGDAHPGREDERWLHVLVKRN